MYSNHVIMILRFTLTSEAEYHASKLTRFVEQSLVSSLLLSPLARSPCRLTTTWTPASGTRRFSAGLSGQDGSLTCSRFGLIDCDMMMNERFACRQSHIC